MNQQELNLGEYIGNKLTEHGDKKILSVKTGINYKSLNDKINFDRFKAYDLLKVAKVLDIDLNELKDRV